jgi:hypothetical protein
LNLKKECKNVNNYLSTITNYSNEKENDLNGLMIKEPELPDKTLENLEIHRTTEEMAVDGDESGPSTGYYFNQINSWNSIKEAFMK